MVLHLHHDGMERPVELVRADPRLEQRQGIPHSFRPVERESPRTASQYALLRAPSPASSGPHGTMAALPGWLLRS